MFELFNDTFKYGLNVKVKVKLKVKYKIAKKWLISLLSFAIVPKFTEMGRSVI